MGWLRRLFGPRRVADEKPRPPGRFELYGEVGGLPDGAVFGAGFAPGFCSDLSCWRQWVYADGRVRQELDVSTADNGYADEERVVEGRIDPDVPGKLVAAAEVAGLEELAGRYDSTWTDVCTKSVAARLPGGVRAVVVDGPHELASQGHEAAIAVLGLWRAAHRYAPWRPEWMGGPSAAESVVADPDPRTVPR